jgi:hypothetical protein
MLGDIEPAASPQVRQYWRKPLMGGAAEAAVVSVEDGIDVPLILLLPDSAKSAPVAVAVAQGGKERFLANRSAEIETLLKSGVAVCLADVRATGETAPSESAGENGGVQGLARREFDLARNLLGSRLKDLRTVLAYLRTRPELDRRRIAVWGESFSPANESPLFLDETETEVGPQIQFQSDPIGAHLALLAALYEPEVQAVAARGGLAGYLSVLDSSFAYVPSDAIILGVVKAGDIADIAAALAPRPVLREATVDGRNIRIDATSRKSVAEWLAAAIKTT